jgi:hypothetical protein
MPDLRAGGERLKQVCSVREGKRPVLLTLTFLGHIYQSRIVLMFTKVDVTYRVVHKNRSQVLTAASMKFRFVFWDVLPCKIIVDRRFRGTCRLHHQGDVDGGNTYL